jgi:hypothetical protein
VAQLAMLACSLLSLFALGRAELSRRLLPALSLSRLRGPAQEDAVAACPLSCFANGWDPQVSHAFYPNS